MQCFFSGEKIYNCSSEHTRITDLSSERLMTKINNIYLTVSSKINIHWTDQFVAQKNQNQTQQTKNQESPSQIINIRILCFFFSKQLINRVMRYPNLREQISQVDAKKEAESWWVWTPIPATSSIHPETCFAFSRPLASSSSSLSFKVSSLAVKDCSGQDVYWLLITCWFATSGHLSSRCKQRKGLSERVWTKSGSTI